MQLSRAQKVRLGAFVLTSLTVLLGSALVLAGLRLWEKRDIYVVRFAASVSGLEESSQVRYQGLRVGRVEAMRVYPEDPRLIEVTMAIEHGTALYEGTEAVLALSGITGLKTINLVPGDPRKARLQPGAELPAGASLMEKLEDDAEIIAQKVARVADQLAEWTNDENRRRVERILDNAAVLSETVEGVIRRTEDPAVAALAQLTRTAASISRLSRVLAGVLEENRGELRLTLATFRATLGEAKRLLAAIESGDVTGTLATARGAMEAVDRRFSDPEVGRLVVQLRGTLEDVTDLLGEVDLAVRASREDFVLALRRVREASEDLREFSRIVAQDPSVLVRGTEVRE